MYYPSVVVQVIDDLFVTLPVSDRSRIVEDRTEVAAQAVFINPLVATVIEAD